MKTFKIGGIHLADNKFSSGKKIQIASIPKTVAIPLGHYAGSISQPIVAKGDAVKVGQLIGKASGFISANVHASVSGKVSKVDVQLDAFGYKRPAVFIDTEGDEWMETIDRKPTIERTCELSSSEIIQKIADAGIVGLGGATFPTHVKLTLPAEKKADVLIINAVECEPYLTCDHQLMLEKGEEIMVGVTILMQALNVERSVIGIECNKKDAIIYFRTLAKTFSGIEIIALQTQYPQGGEKQLIEATIQRKVPSGKLPIEVGAVVVNVATTFAVYEAVQKNKPLLERVITITGKSLINPANMLVRIGTMLSEVVDKLGGVPIDTGKIIGGGPMMGRALLSLNVPMAKGSAGILFVQNAESIRKTMQHCIRCARCIKVCPMGLEPYLLMNQGEKKMWTAMKENKVLDCIECGSCNYVCPSHRGLLDYIRFGKTVVNKAN